MNDLEIQELANQYKGATLAMLIEKQIKSMDLDVLDSAIQGTYQEFKNEYRKSVDKYTFEYMRSWFGEKAVKEDLGIIFSECVADAKHFSNEQGFNFSNEDCFNIFNLTVMRISHFASENKDFRKMLGIKKGWFS